MTTIELKDYEGVYKYKLISPIIFVFGLVTASIGPAFYPVFTLYYHFGWLLFAFFKFLTSAISLMYATMAQAAIAKGIHNPDLVVQDSKGAYLVQALYHVFVIPSYGQKYNLLSETIGRLAQHSEATSKYLVVLAMEKHEEGSGQKARRLIAAHKDSFIGIQFTLHEIKLAYQQKSKASNLSWCLSRLEPLFLKYNMQKEQVFLTIQDADSWAPCEYIGFVEKEIARLYSERNNLVFVPSQIFGRNRLEVSPLIRVVDDMHAYAHLSNLVTAAQLSFPFANYTFSYEFIVKVGLFDVSSDAMGEDFHIILKSFYKTNGLLRTVPIHTPWNQLNICTGQGLWNDFKSKFWQCQRHMEGAASDIAYIMKRQVQNPLSFRQWSLTHSTFEAFFLNIGLVLVIASFNGYNAYNFIYGKQVGSVNPTIQYFSMVLLNVMGVGSLILLIFYEHIRQLSNFHFFNRTDQTLFRGVVEVILYYTTCIVLILTPCSVIAAFKVFVRNRQFVVSKKINAQTSGVDLFGAYDNQQSQETGLAQTCS